MFGFRDPRGAESAERQGAQLATLGPAGQERMGGPEGEAACLRLPESQPRRPPRVLHESQPQRPPRPCCPSPDHPLPPALGTLVLCRPASIHLPGQAPPLYLGTRQRQVVPEKLRPEPWALSSLTAGILLWPLAQGVSGQPCGCVRGSLCRTRLGGQPWMELTPQPCVPYPSAGSRGPVGRRPPS